jgi:hypothetical protein
MYQSIRRPGRSGRGMGPLCWWCCWRLVALEGYGLSVAEWLPLEIPASASTLRYLKKNKLGHVLSGPLS